MPCDLRIGRLIVDSGGAHRARLAEPVDLDHIGRDPALQRLPGETRRCARGQCKRSEEHTSELQSLMRNSYAVFCLKTQKNKTQLEKRHPQPLKLKIIYTCG